VTSKFDPKNLTSLNPQSVSSSLNIDATHKDRVVYTQVTFLVNCYIKCTFGQIDNKLDFDALASFSCSLETCSSKSSNYFFKLQSGF
jgi:hypothetical protein